MQKHTLVSNYSTIELIKKIDVRVDAPLSPYVNAIRAKKSGKLTIQYLKVLSSGC